MKTVLFVCVHNSDRSQMAEAFFNQLAAGRAQAFSAGTQPADAVHPVVIEAMREVGIDISRNRPKVLTLEAAEEADRIVTMGCGVEGVCPAGMVETEDWNLDDPQGMTLEGVRHIRDETRERVVALLEEIAAGPGPGISGPEICPADTDHSAAEV